MIDRANRKLGDNIPNPNTLSRKVEEKDFVSHASKEWNQPEITRIVKLSMGKGFEKLHRRRRPRDRRFVAGQNRPTCPPARRERKMDDRQPPASIALRGPKPPRGFGLRALRAAFISALNACAHRRTSRRLINETSQQTKILSNLSRPARKTRLKIRRRRLLIISRAMHSLAYI
jgi:hypothetical protein